MKITIWTIIICLGFIGTTIGFVYLNKYLDNRQKDKITTQYTESTEPIIIQQSDPPQPTSSQPVQQPQKVYVQPQQPQKTYTRPPAPKLDFTPHWTTTPPKSTTCSWDRWSASFTCF